MSRYVCTAVLLLAGCGQTEFKVVPVSGTVKLDGQPLTNGVVHPAGAERR